MHASLKGLLLAFPREYSLHHWDRVSLMYWKPLLEVKLPNTSAACTVRVTNPQRDSADRKLKAWAPQGRPALQSAHGLAAAGALTSYSRPAARAPT